MVFKALINKAPNMDSLVALGSSAAVVYGIFAIYKIRLWICLSGSICSYEIQP